MSEDYVLTSVIDKGSKHAGPKAKEDIEYFLAKDGYHDLTLALPKGHIDKLLFTWTKLNALFKNKKIKKVVFQYPIYSVYLTKKIIAAIRKNTQAKVVVMIHDIESIRVYNGQEKFFKDEISIFNSVDGLIVHNAGMETWLKNHGVHTKMIQLGIFDYHNPVKLIEQQTFTKSICYAGNLAKAEFLEKLNLRNSSLDVFGPNQAEEYPENINYHGSFPAEELPSQLNQNFGLIWDGDSLDSCVGLSGDYMRINAPHKTSLYLSCGIPVIVWEKAAVANFVQTNQVGIAVKNLHELDDIMKNMTAEEYNVKVQNAVQIAKKIRMGYFIHQATAKF